MLALFIGLTGCDASVSPMEDTNPPPERPDASSSALSVALLPGGMHQASSEDGPAYRCTANVFDPEAEAGYRTYDLALAFPDSVRADSSSEVESAFTELNFTLSLEPTADSTAADSTARQTASRVRCNVPPTEAALALMADRIEADLHAQFGEDGYRFVDSDSSAAGQAGSSAQRAGQDGSYDGAAFRSNYVQDVPDYLTCFDGGGGAMVCLFNEVTVTASGGGGYTPTIPTPPDPGAPSGPGDDGTPSGGGSPSDPTDCSGSLQGPTPESTTAYPASGDAPSWLIPQPDADPGSDLLDPDYPDNPTPADPGGTGCDDEETSEDEPEEEKSIPQVKDFSTEVDTVDIAELPDCDDPTGANELGDSDIPSRTWEDYCESSLPTDTQRQRIEETLDSIEDRGTVCAQIAQRARLYLDNNLIYIDPTADRAGGWGYDGLVIIWSDYVDSYHDDRTKKDDGYARDGNLDSILAHEFDHVLGAEGHIQGTFNTTHQAQCSGL